MSHSPPASIRPSTAWELGTGALLFAIAGSGGFTVAGLVIVMIAMQYVYSEGETLPPFVVWIVESPRIAALFDVLTFVSLIMYLIGFFVWRNRTHALVRRYGFEPKAMTKHPGVAVWSIATVLAFCAGRLARVSSESTADDVAAAIDTSILVGLMRVVGLIGLAIAVWGIRQRVHLSLATYQPAPAFTPPPSYPEAAPIPAAPPAPARDVPGIDGLPVADDDFWHRVRQASADGDLALLETSGPHLHRWVLIPADQDPAAVRDGLAPGSAITVFTDPITRREPDGYRPPAADEYHGLLESAATGALWYQPVTARRLTSFLDRAATGGRWALYPVGDPNTLAARLP